MDRLDNVDKLIRFDDINRKKNNQYEYTPNYTVLIPEPFFIQNNMLYMNRTQGTGENITEMAILICRHIPVITRSFADIESMQLHYEVSWINNGTQYSEVVRAGDIAIKKELLNLADVSLAVNDINARDLIRYFDRFLMFNDIPMSKTVERLGHIKEHFIHPLNIKDIELLPADIGERQIINAFEANGSSEEWLNHVFNKIEKHPKALLMVLASFTSVILDDLKLGPFIVDLSGVTSKGKTTVLKVAASVWGNEHLVSEWNGTAVSFERKAAFLNSFPLMLDDSMKADERHIQRFIYNFSGGRSKGRGTLTGSQREDTWNNLLLSTGEVKLTDYAERAGGAAARILPIHGLPFEKVDYSFFDDIYQAIEQYHGTIGIDFLTKWQEHQKDQDFMKDYQKINALFQQKSHGNEVVSRIARHYSAIYYTGTLLMKFFKIGIDLGWIEFLFDETIRETSSTDKPIQMLEEILLDLDSQREAISSKYEPKTELKAIYKNGVLHLLPSYLKNFLKHEHQSVRNEWARRGISLTHESNGKTVDTKLLKHLRKTYRVLAIDPRYIEEAGYDFNEKE